MYVTYINHHHIHDLDFEISRPNGSGDYLALLLKSPAAFTIDGQTLITAPNTFFLYKEGMPQYYQAYGEPLVNDWFQFKLDDDEKDFFETLNIPFQTPIPIKSQYHFSLFIKMMATDSYTASPHSHAIIDCLLKILFLKLSDTLQSPSITPSHSSYEKLTFLRNRIYDHPYEKWSISSLSRELTLSPYYFQRLYKKTFGVPCMTDIIHARIEHSKYYLQETDLPIKYIAESSGYESCAHFMRQFKQLTGITPSEYRAQIKNL